MDLLSFSYDELKNIRARDFLMRFYAKAIDEEDITSNAAQVAFYFAFALFPLLLFLVTLFGFVLESANDLRAEMFFYLRQVMPFSAYELVEKTVQEVTEGSSSGKLTIGILAAIWAASAGIDSIRTVMNGVYNLAETRPFWKTKLTSLVMTLGLGVLVTLALGIVFYGGKFVMLILNSLNLPIESPFVLSVLQWMMVLVVLISIFALLYNFLPNHKKFNWIWVSPGAIISIGLWLMVSYAFRLYLGYFDTYSKTYGSLGAMIILMLWLYLTALVILVGGTINAILQEFTDPETAEAGANKAAAKEAIANPQNPLSVAAAAETKAKILSMVQHNSADATAENQSAANGAPSKVKPKKSALKLAAGLIVGFVQNIFSGKKP